LARDLVVGSAFVKAPVAICLALAVAACTAVDQPHACLAGKPAIETQLYFGLAKSHGAVSAREWQAFVEHEIAPRFPEGFTILDARGFWLSEEAKRTISENSKVLIHVHEGGTKNNVAIGAIIESYKRAFAQDSVLRVDETICAAF
jgi:hypothetical protein